jgi:adenylylsulfate kinase
LNDKNKIPAIFLIGFSGSGKTTLGLLIKEELIKMGKSCIQCDADQLAQYKLLSKFNGFDIGSRLSRAKQLVNIINWSLNQNIIPIATVIGQPAKAREYWRKNIKGYKEIYLKCSLEHCMKRDNKNLYNGSDKDILGVDISFEEPSSSDIILDSELHKPEELLAIIKSEYLESLFHID